MKLAQAYKLINMSDDTATITAYRCPAQLLSQLQQYNQRYGLDNSKSTRLFVALGLEYAESDLVPLLNLLEPPSAVNN